MTTGGQQASSFFVVEPSPLCPHLHDCTLISPSALADVLSRRRPIPPNVAENGPGTGTGAETGAGTEGESDDTGAKWGLECGACGSCAESWVCLHCGQVGCSRYVGGHMQQHLGEAGHLLCASFADLSIWCNHPGCLCYVRHEILYPLLSELEKAKFGKPATRKAQLYPKYCTGIMYDTRLEMHHHPEGRCLYESPERTVAIYHRLLGSGMLTRCRGFQAREATRNELCLVHSAEYVDTILGATDIPPPFQRKDLYWVPETPLCAKLACGALLELVKNVIIGNIQNGFALIRPPGHHARINSTSGFCFFNNIAVAAACTLQGRFDSKPRRVLILDFDVHHGDGTQEIFYNEPSALFISIHRLGYAKDMLFGENPDIAMCEKVGGPNALGKNVNIPLPWSETGFSDADYLAIMDRLVIPISREFSPDVVLVSAGFDSGKGDPVGGAGFSPASKFGITPQCFSHIVHLMKLVSGGRVILSLEGGYEPQVASTSAEACLSALLGEQPPPTLPPLIPNPETIALIAQVTAAHRPYWRSL
ncbi:histone deacetylase clr3 [Pelomyxa schiedti]|nr:histone deacetylase clr3 [Pelomyxa schiedti]